MCRISIRTLLLLQVTFILLLVFQFSPTFASDASNCDDTNNGSCLATVEASCEAILGAKVEQDFELHSIPDDVSLPDNLENSVEFDISVGFRRLRHALLHQKESTFWLESVLKGALQYTEVKVTEWDHHDNYIGRKEEDTAVADDDFIGAKKITEYIMPKTTLVAANKATETAKISQYNNYYFVLNKSTLTPDVPFGSRFVAKTRIVLINTGNNTSKLIFSVEAEFPNGEPMGMGWQIRRGMKNGSFETFAKINDVVMTACAA